MSFDAGLTVYGEDLSRGEGWCYKKILRAAPRNSKKPRAPPPPGSVAIVHCNPTRLTPSSRRNWPRNNVVTPQMSDGCSTGLCSTPRVKGDFYP